MFSLRTLGPLILSTCMAACGDDSAGGPDASSPDGSLVDSAFQDASRADGALGDTREDIFSNDTSSGDADASLPSDGHFPRLSDFRVEAAEPFRVYFESSEPLRGSNFDGFVVSGRTLSEVVVAPGTMGHYFVVSEPFDFYDNNTIRFEGGGDVRDAEDNLVHPFTMQFIRNDLPEPSAPESRYVSATAAGTGSGLSEADPWTAAQAMGQLQSGMTVWMKAGDYGDQELRIDASGTPDEPIKIVGYRSSPGDITQLYFDYETTSSLDPEEMPFFDHGQGGSGTAIGVSGDYVFVENVQVTNYANGFAAYSDPVGVVFRRCLAHTLGRTAGQPGDQGMGFRVLDHDTLRVRILDSTVVNASIDNFIVYGSYNLIAGCKSYCDRTDQSAGEATDYYFVLAGTNTIFRSNHIERALENTHGGHGICFRNSSLEQPVEYNLAEDSTVVGVGGSIEFRHENIRHNVARNISIRGGVIPKTSRYPADGPVFRDGTSFNTVENCEMRGLRTGVRFRDTPEEGTEQVAGSHNRVINSVVEDCEYGVWAFDDGPDIPVVGNEISGCVFRNVDHLYYDRSSILGPGNVMRNTLLYGVRDRKSSGDELAGGFEETHNLYFAGFDAIVAEGNIAVDPGFRSADSLVPTNAALRAGVVVEGLEYDRLGHERAAPPTIGVFEIATP